MFYLNADDFTPELRELDRMASRPESLQPAHLNDFSPEEWAVVLMARDACLSAGDIVHAPGSPPLVAHLRQVSAFDVRNPTSTPRHRSSLL